MRQLEGRRQVPVGSLRHNTRQPACSPRPPALQCHRDACAARVCGSWICFHARVSRGAGWCMRDLDRISPGEHRRSGSGHACVQTSFDLSPNLIQTPELQSSSLEQSAIPRRAFVGVHWFFSASSSLAKFGTSPTLPEPALAVSGQLVTSSRVATMLTSRPAAAHGAVAPRVA